MKWYRYNGPDSRPIYVLVETKFCDISLETALKTPREAANRVTQDAYKLVKQFRTAETDKFNVLHCRGIHYSDDLTDRTTLLVWSPPVEVSEPAKAPSLRTLREALSNIEDERILLKIASRPVKTVYKLLMARWYHHSLCLDNVIAFDDDWERPYLLGFATARLSNGFSEPGSQPKFERYFQHPDR